MWERARFLVRLTQRCGSAKRCAHAEEPERRQSASSMAGNAFEVFGVFAVQFLSQC